MSKIVLHRPVEYKYKKGLMETEVDVYNAFGGMDTEDVQVLKSAAGYYIGTLYEEMNIGYLPNERLSEEYWSTREEAEEKLRERTY